MIFASMKNRYFNTSPSKTINIKEGLRFFHFKVREISSASRFQRIAQSDKKDFLSDQCKEIEENNRMGKTRDLFKKIRDTKGTFHAKMGTIKDRNAMH